MFPKSNDNDVKNIIYNAPVVHKKPTKTLKTLIPGLPSRVTPTNTYAKVITQTCTRNHHSAQLISARAIQNSTSCSMQSPPRVQLSKLLNMKAKHYNTAKTL
ncbi:hypothetical protein CDAR_53291 [Caerostris darwini]|uniref:Uncharacterized protein n=1 Tax=Caerostris darwini TaxID=1538125 RepID=A0AAV4S6U5_9ARAC|nr:hypothetical protein CDAR_53291 [Caerostris darwini]